MENDEINPDNQEENNLWQEILNNEMSKKENIVNKNIFVFGDKLSGKKSLFEKMSKLITKKEDNQNKKTLKIDKDFSKFGLIDYLYLNIRSHSKHFSEIKGNANIWIIKETITKDSFKKLLKPEDIRNGMCIIVVDLERAYSIKESITKWLNFIQEIIQEIFTEKDKLKEMQQKQIDFVKLYQEPVFDKNNNLVKVNLSEEQKKELLQKPLPEGVLKTNIGIPIAIVVNKVRDDIYRAYIGGKTNINTNTINPEELPQFILSHIRNIAIEYGASIIYTSPKNNINISILYDYICHVLYNFDLNHKPNLIDTNIYFVPSGCDNLTLLSENEECERYKGQLYHRIIFPSKTIKKQEEEDVSKCEDFYKELIKQQILVIKNLNEKKEEQPKKGEENSKKDEDNKIDNSNEKKTDKNTDNNIDKDKNKINNSEKEEQQKVKDSKIIEKREEISKEVYNSQVKNMRSKFITKFKVKNNK